LQNDERAGAPFAQKYERWYEVEIPQSDSSPFAIERDAGEIVRRLRRAKADVRTNAARNPQRGWLLACL